MRALTPPVAPRARCSSVAFEMDGVPATYDLFFKNAYQTNGGYMFDCTVTFQVQAQPPPPPCLLSSVINDPAVGSWETAAAAQSWDGAARVGWLPFALFRRAACVLPCLLPALLRCDATCPPRDVGKPPPALGALPVHAVPCCDMTWSCCACCRTRRPSTA